MFGNYFRIAVRNLLRSKVYSFINIFGLAVGIACCIVVFLFVRDELSFDRFHENTDRIYRIVTEITLPNGVIRLPYTKQQMAEDIEKDFPEVQNSVRLTHIGAQPMAYGGRRFKEIMFFADANFLEMFNFPLVLGNKETVLKDLNTAVITEKFADKYFGGEDPVGKIITVDNREHYTVTGILKDLPKNTDFRFDILVSFESMKNLIGADLFDNGSFAVWTYVLLTESASPKEIESKMPDFVNRHFEHLASWNKYFLQPLIDIHLYSDLYYGNPSSINYSYIFSGIGILILLIACANFVNLSTARAVRRAKEVGLRKVVGAERYQLIRQFLGESVLLSFFALFGAVILAYLFLPTFNSLAGKELAISFNTDPLIFGGLILIALVTGLVSGIYPAFVLSSFRPIDILSGTVRGSGSLGKYTRKGLVVLQYSLSLVFIIAAIIVLYQVDFLKNKDLGFNTDSVIAVDLTEDIAIGDKYDLIRTELLQNPDIISMSASNIDPGTYGGYPETFVPSGFNKDEPVLLSRFLVNENFFSFFEIEKISGRYFSADITTDPMNAVILNESAVKEIGWDSPLGERIFIESDHIRYSNKGNATAGRGVNRDFTVIGVIKDFHAGPLREVIQPSIYFYRPDMYNYFYLKVRPDRTQNVIRFLEQKWKGYAPHVMFEYSLLSDDIESLYKEEEKTGKMFLYSSILAILLASLGAFGLAVFASEQRIKEIGIRKVMGATVSNILLMLSKDILKPVLAANIIAWPVAYYIMEKWLRDFAYRISFEWWIFAFSGVLVLIISIFTISYQTAKAASANPVETLRYE